MFLFFSVGPLESARQFLTKVLIRFSSELCKLKDQLKTSGFCTGCRILERALLPASQQFTHLFSISGALLSFQKIWVSLWFHFPSALRTLLSFSHNAGWLLTTSPSDDISISPSFLKDIFAGDKISGCQLLSLILALQTCSTGFWFLLILWELHGNLGHLGHYSPGLFSSVQFSSVQSLSRVQLFATPWTAACQASLSITNFRSLLKLMSIESVMPSNISSSVVPLSLFLLSSIFLSIRVFFQWVGPSHQVAEVLELQDLSLQRIFRVDFL